MATGLSYIICFKRGDVPIITLNLNTKRTLNNPVLIDIILKVFYKSFYSPFTASEVEQEYAERNRRLLVPYLIKDKELTTILAITTEGAKGQLEPFY